MSRNKRPREEIFDFNPAKFAKHEPGSSSSDSDGDGMGDFGLNAEVIQQACDKIKRILNPLLPTFKKYMGADPALNLRTKLLNIEFCPGMDLDKEVEEVKQICDALIASWSGKERKTLSEAEKDKLRGKEAADEWEVELVDLELVGGLTYFPLKMLAVKEEGDNGERTEDDDAIPLSELSLKHFREVPYILASPDIYEEEKALWERLNDECDGLVMLNTNSTNQILNAFEEQAEMFQSCFDAGKFDDAFNCVFSTTKVMKSIEHWYNDFENADAVAEVMKGLLTCWNLVLAKSDAQLQISGKPNFRNDLKTWLDELAKDVKEGSKDAGEEVKFTWKVVI